MPRYIPPLHIHVVFCETHPHGEDWAKGLARWFTGARDDDCPEARLRVFVWQGTKTQPPLDVPWGEAQRTALILLVDDGFADAWRAWAAKQAATKRAGDLLLPCTTQAEDPAFEEKERREDLFLHVTHTLGDWFTGRGAGGRRTHLFISHAKAKHRDVSGRDLALALQAFVRQRPAGATFFDEVAITAGDDFETKLTKGLDGATVVVILTDRFSTRYWCRWEVVTAKSMQRPMLVVDALVEGERTSLAYLGNARTIRWDPSAKDDPGMHRRIITGALLEQLRFDHDAAMLAAVKEVAAPAVDTETIARPVELLTLPPARAGGARTLVLHPDPPLPAFEIGMVRRHRPDVDLASVTQALSGSLVKADPLRGKRIAVSIPDGTDAEVAANGLRRELLERLWADIAMVLITAGAELAYDVDLLQKGYTRRLLDLLEWAGTGLPPPEVVHLYAAWSVVPMVSEEQAASFPGAFVLHRHVRPKELDEACFPRADPEHRFACTLSMRDVCRAMARDCHARVLVGGQLRLLEELETFLAVEKPVYLIGAFGGMTRVIIHALQGSKARAGTVGFEGVPAIDLPGRLTKLRERGVAGLRNGLSVEENERLFVTRDSTEMIVLVLQGLRMALRS